MYVVLLRWGVDRPLAARGVRRLQLRVRGGLRASVRRILRHDRVLVLIAIIEEHMLSGFCLFSVVVGGGVYRRLLQAL